MRLNAATGFLRYIGDFDRAGVQVPRIGDGEEGRRLRGMYSLHSLAPMIEDTVRDADDRPTPVLTPDFRTNHWDGTTYNKFVAIDVVLPPDRIGDVTFADYVTRATQRVIPYTLEVAEVNVIQQRRADVTIRQRRVTPPPVKYTWTVGGTRWHL